MAPHFRTGGEARMRGSIVKRKWRRTVSWAVVVDAGTDPATGRRRQRWTTYRTRREAELFLAQALAHGAGMSSPRMRFRDLADYWLVVCIQNSFTMIDLGQNLVDAGGPDKRFRMSVVLCQVLVDGALQIAHTR